MIRPAGSRTSNEPSRPAWTNYQIKGLICLYKCRTVVDLNLFVGHIQLSREFLPYGLQLLLQVVPLLFQWQTSNLKLLSHLLRQHKRKDNIRRTKAEQLKKRYIQTVWQSAAGIWSRFNYSEEKALSSKETFSKSKVTWLPRDDKQISLDIRRDWELFSRRQKTGMISLSLCHHCNEKRLFA